MAYEPEGTPDQSNTNRFMEKGIITFATDHPIAEIVETGLYANVYQNLNEGGLEVGKYYDSPSDAEKNIDWDQVSLKYVFTAKMSHRIFTFKKP